MTGGSIIGVGRQGGVYIAGGTFNMSGGIITECYGTNGQYSGSVTVSGTGSVFNMSGTAEISGNYAFTVGGGAVQIFSGNTFNMIDGIIKNNYVVSNANNANCLGGGVYIHSGGTFKKTGGTIYGSDASTSDWNRITNTPSTVEFLGQGYAVYCEDGHKVRDITANSTDNLDSDIVGEVGGWKPPLTTGAVSISGTGLVGQTLTATIDTDLDGTGEIVYMWMQYRGTPPTPMVQQISTTSTFSPTFVMQGDYFTVRVFRRDNSGSITSTPLVP